MIELSDQQLLIKMHSGHHAATEMLWKRLSLRLLVFARSLTRDGMLAEDAVQSTFMRVLTLSKREVQKVKDPLAWLMMVVRREAFQALRARGRAARREYNHCVDERTDQTQASGTSRDGHDWSVGPELRAQLEAALETLPRRDREVIMLRHFVMLTFDQMELALGIPRSTVVSRYREAVHRLELRMQTDTKPHAAHQDSLLKAPVDSETTAGHFMDHTAGFSMSILHQQHGEDPKGSLPLKATAKACK